MAFNGILLVLVGFYLPLVIHVLLNEKFWSVGPTTFVLTLSVALYNLYFIFWIGANVAKKNRLIPVITLIASGVNVGLNFLLVPTTGCGRRRGRRCRLRDPRGARVLHLQPLVPDPLRVAAAVTLAGAAALTLGAAWAIGWAVGVRSTSPSGDSSLASSR